jgi:transposase InsO family protein
MDRGPAGRSAQAEFERRHHKREERIDAKFGRLASVVKFLLMTRNRPRHRQAARPARCAWLNWYNTIRLHSSLDFCPPIEHEEHLAQQSLVA